mmetsp:Transcript_15449/g.32674  ORF Transcript_15449/g.32674 Transcript_15449/m.32674 type:complete len:345 (+) Transcript_15449:75-1109(+)
MDGLKRTVLEGVAALLFFLATAVSGDNEVKVLQSLKSAYPGWKPRGVIDVGANRGGWTKSMQALYPGVKTFMVEASKHHEKEMEETKNSFEPNVVDYKIAVLSSTDGEIVDFYSNPGPGTGNSMFLEQTSFFSGTIPEKRNTSKLDSVLEDMQYADYLKLDVQGAELVVLSGATETLSKATFVQLEVSILEYNKGGACWYEIDEFLRDHGFVLYDVDDIIRESFHTKAAVWMDVLYIRPSSDYMPKWLVDDGAKFCGIGRDNMAANNKTATTAGDVGSTATATGGIGSNSNDNIFVFVFVAFFGGYFLGGITAHGSKLQRRNVWKVSVALFVFVGLYHYYINSL